MLKRTYNLKFILLYLVTLLIYSKGSAQLSVEGTPYSFNNLAKSAVVIPELQLEQTDVQKELDYDAENRIENRFAIGETVNIDIKEEGAVTYLDHGIVYQYHIEAEGAKSIGLFFDDYFLPDGAELFVYNTDRSMILGAFTSENNKETRKLSLAQLVDDDLIIDYYEPNNVDFKGSLFLGKVFKSYKELNSVLEVSADRVGINCPEGTDWQDEKHSVCRMFFYEGGSGYFCTGALINNTLNDCMPYFLTANHCINTEQVANTLVTYFNYENSSCSSNDASFIQTLSGATLKASYSSTDVSLLRLTEQPPNSYEPYYAGWDATGDKPTFGTAIHHPKGTPKCISSGSNVYSYPREIPWDNYSSTPSNSHWAISFESGGTEQGSSGSPLFDQNSRIIGQLHGGYDDVSFYGRISAYWTHGLNQYLDPVGKGTKVLDGISYEVAPKAEFEIESAYGCTSSPIRLYDKTRIASDKWTWSIFPSTYEFKENTTENSQNPVVQFLEDDRYSISLIVENEFGADTLIQEDIISITEDLNVHFVNMNEYNVVCGNEFDGIELIAEGALDYEFEIINGEKLSKRATNNTLTISLPLRYRRDESFSFSVIVNGYHGECSDADTVYFDVIIPVSDYIEDAANLSFGVNSGYSNECSGTEGSEPQPLTGGCTVEDRWCSDFPLLNNTLWFTFVAPSSGVVTIETAGFDTQIAIYSGDTYEDILSENYEFIAANDNPASNIEEAKLEDIEVIPGKRYWLQVDGNYGATGDLTINMLSNSLEVRPNPALNSLEIVFASKEAADVRFQIYTINGNQYTDDDLSVDLDNNTYTIDVTNIPSGVYFLRATIGGETFVKKIQVQH